MNLNNSKKSDPYRLLPNIKEKACNGTRNFNYVMSYILYQIFKIVLG